MGICPKASSLQVSREIGINSGAKGNMAPQTSRSNHMEGTDVSGLRMKLREVWCEGRGE